MLQAFPQGASDRPADDLESAVWIDLLNPTEDEAARVQEALGIQLPSLEALREIEASSRLRVDGDIIYLSAPLLSGTDTESWKIAPTGFVLTHGHCVTVRFDDLPVFDSLAKELGQSTDGLNAKDIFLRLLESVVDRAADHLERAAEVVNEASHTIFFEEFESRRLTKNSNAMRDAMRKIGKASDRASRVRYMFLSVGRMVAFVLDRCPSNIDQSVRDRLEAAKHDIASLDEFENSLSGRIQLLQDAASGFISIAQNDVVKVLTIVSVVGVPPVLVVGIYGMNFKNMPELDWTYGYPFALALCVLSVIIPLVWLKWRGWF